MPAAPSVAPQPTCRERRVSRAQGPVHQPFRNRCLALEYRLAGSGTGARTTSTRTLTGAQQMRVNDRPCGFWSVEIVDRASLANCRARHARRGFTKTMDEPSFFSKPLRPGGTPAPCDRGVAPASPHPRTRAAPWSGPRWRGAAPAQARCFGAANCRTRRWRPPPPDRRTRRQHGRAPGSSPQVTRSVAQSRHSPQGRE
jgi:hypothetical protein